MIYILRRGCINVHFKSHTNRVYLLEEIAKKDAFKKGVQSMKAWEKDYNLPEYVVNKFEVGEPIYTWTNHPHYKDDMVVVKQSNPILSQPIIVGLLTKKGKLWYAGGCIT